MPGPESAEGPTGPASNRLLSSAEIVTLKPLVAVRTRAEFRSAALWCALAMLVAFHLVSLVWRWRGVEGDGFLLAKARESSHSSDLARVAKRLVSSEQARLRLVVKPPSAHGAAIKVEAPIAGHREDVAKALAPCLLHVK